MIKYLNLFLFFILHFHAQSQHNLSSHKIEYLDSIAKENNIIHSYDTIHYDVQNTKTVFFVPEYRHNVKAGLDADVISSQLSLKYSSCPIIIESSRNDLLDNRSEIYKAISANITLGDTLRSTKEIEELTLLVKAYLSANVVFQTESELQKNAFTMLLMPKKNIEQIKTIKAKYIEQFNAYKLPDFQNTSTSDKKREHIKGLFQEEIIHKRNRFLMRTIDSALS